VSSAPSQSAGFSPAEIARAFVSARRGARALADFPGPLPADMAAGYAVQDAAIALWPEELVGWKVGKIPPELVAELGAERVAGPIFKTNVSQASRGTASVLPVIENGFAAVEAEYIYRIGEDAPAGKTDWTADAALALVEDELVGVEFAGSPLASINVLGPKVVASDFGNNAGLILGRSIPDWKARADDWPPVEAYVGEALVGRGAPSTVLPGGPPMALAFLANLCAARGRPLKRGQLVTTGAASGIHDIRAGETARIVFADLDEIHCIAQPARPFGDD
jgi:2-keto-4-pentenoate hydratase